MLSPDVRGTIQKDALEAARWYQKQSLDRMRAISLGAAGLEVRGPRRALGQGGSHYDEGWYSEGRDPMDLVM